MVNITSNVTHTRTHNSRPKFTMKGEGYDQKLKAYHQYNDTTHTEMLFLNKEYLCPMAQILPN